MLEGRGNVHLQSKHDVEATLYDADWNELARYKLTQGGYGERNAMVPYEIAPRWSVTLDVHKLFDPT